MLVLMLVLVRAGTSGAGRAAKEAFLFCEVADGIHAYGISSHRHCPEIEQGLSAAAQEQVRRRDCAAHYMPRTDTLLLHLRI